MLFILFGAPFVAIGIGLLTWSVLPLVARLRVARPDVSVSKDTLSPGETFSFVFQQNIRFSAEVQGVRIALVFRESATYRQGTRTTTSTHDNVIAEAERPGEPLESGSTLREEIRFTIPVDAMHTFAASKNTLQWLITIRVNIAGWPDFQEAYPIQVRPANTFPSDHG